jgi:hypothetical protein
MLTTHSPQKVVRVACADLDQVWRSFCAALAECGDVLAHDRFSFRDLIDRQDDQGQS